MYDFLYSFSDWTIPNFKIIWLFQRIKKEEITLRAVCDTIEPDTKTREKILFKMLIHHSFIPRIKGYLKIRKFNVIHHINSSEEENHKIFSFDEENLSTKLNIYLLYK